MTRLVSALSLIPARRAVADDGPAPRVALFVSDWSTALGSGDAALRDTNKQQPWVRATAGGGGPTGLEVVTTATSGRAFPTTNALRVTARARSGGVYADQLWCNSSSGTQGVLPIPAVGEHRYFRWYISREVPNSVNTSGGAPHGIQDGESASVSTWMHETVMNSDSTWGRWVMSFAGGGNVSPNNRWGPNAFLNKFQAYRIEYHFERVGTLTFYPEVRIYDANDVLLYDENTIMNNAGTGATSMVALRNAGTPLTMESGDITVSLSNLVSGNNGPSWASAVGFPFLMNYQAGIAIATDDWCGPYGSLHYYNSVGDLVQEGA